MLRAANVAVLIIAALLPIPMESGMPPVSEPALFRAPEPEAPEAGAAWVEMDAAILAGLATAEDPHAAGAVSWVLLNRAGCTFLTDAPPPAYSCARSLMAEATARHAFGTIRVWPGDTEPSWRPAWYPGRPAAPGAELTAAAILAGSLPDPTGGATHFHRVGTWVPPWAPHPRARQRFGSHEFYRAL